MISFFEKKNKKRKRKREKRQCCAKKIQLCWKNKHISYPIGIDKIFKTLLEIKIKNHENEDLEFYMKNHSSRVNDMIKGCGKHTNMIRYGICCDYDTLFYEACEAKNYDCIPILVKNGMGPDAFIRDYSEEWESFHSSPLRMAFSKLDANMIEVLIHEGFQTGQDSTCPDCRECGWPQTCLFEKLFSSENMNKISDEDILKIIRVSNWDHVLSTYTRLVYDCWGGKMIDTLKMNRIQTYICKTIPIIKIPVYITERNVDYVMDMINSNIVNVDKLLQRITIRLLGEKFTSFWKLQCRSSIPHMSVKKVFKCIKDIIDFGADISRTFTLDCTGFYSDLPKKKDKTFYNLEWPYGSFEDIIFSVVRGKDETIKNIGQKCLSYNNKDKDHINEIFHHLEDLCFYIKYKKRAGYLQKRVRGLEDNHDKVIEKFMDMDTVSFCKVMSYII